MDYGHDPKTPHMPSKGIFGLYVLYEFHFKVLCIGDGSCSCANGERRNNNILGPKTGFYKSSTMHTIKILFLNQISFIFPMEWTTLTLITSFNQLLIALVVLPCNIFIIVLILNH